MIVEDLKKSILQEAFNGNLTKNMNFSKDINLSLNIKEKNGKFKFDESKLYEIPSTWRWIKLENLSTILGDVLHGTPIYDNNGEYYFINGNNLCNGRIVIKEDTKKVSNQEYNKYKKNLNNNTMLISINGTIGNIGFYNGEKIILGKSACYFNLLDFVNQKYLYYFFQTKWALDFMINNATGTTIKNVSLDVMRNIRIPFAPLEEQNAIVKRIEELFDKINYIKPLEDELNEVKNKFPSDMKKSILNFAYTGNLLEGITNYDDWNISSILKIVDVCTGNSISESIKKNKYSDLESGYNYIATKDLGFDHIFNYSNGVKIPFEEEGFKYANKNDILLCIEGGSAGKKIGILSEKVCFGNKLCKFSIKNEEMDSKYLYYYLQSPVFLKNFYGNLSGIIGGVSINKIKQLEIKYPSLEEQKKIVEKIEQLLPLCEDIEHLVNN